MKKVFLLTWLLDTKLSSIVPFSMIIIPVTTIQEYQVQNV